MNSEAELTALLDLLVHRIPAWCGRAAAGARFLSRTFVTGEFRSRRVMAHGAERAEPRAFTLEDEPDSIDMGRLPAIAAVDFIAAAIGGKLRVAPAIKTIESEFLVVIDLSRSMLDGFISEQTDDQSAHLNAKLNGLFFGVAAFLHVAAGLGFRMRVLHSLGAQRIQEIGGAPRTLLLSTLSRMGDALLRSRERAAGNEDATQPFNLRFALRDPAAVRGPGVVLLVSDFLDPFSSYSAALSDVAARRHVILADVAREQDRNYHVPTILEQAIGAQRVREGARHLEVNTKSRPKSESAVRLWNDERQRDYQALLSTARSHGMTYRSLAGPAATGGEAGFLRCYRLAYQRLKELN